MKDLYLGTGIENIEELQRKINDGKAPRSVYLITLAANQENLLDLLPGSALRKQIIYDNCPEIIGLAGSKADAIDLTGKILLECYRKTGHFRVDTYLENKRNR